MPHISHLISVETLRGACNQWFAENFGVKPWYPGLPHPSSVPDGPLDVVFFGDFLEQLLDKHQWRRQQRLYRLWTLCSSSRNFCIQKLGISSKNIGVIPRYDLIKKHAPERPFPKKGEPWTLVFAGRFAAEKNMDLCTGVVSALQTQFGEPVGFVCFGSPSSEGFNGTSEFGTFGDFFTSWYTRFPWVTSPLYLGALDREEWLKYPLTNPVFISLSTYHREDFGLAAAQAQGEGWPCILSHWGGHVDVVGKSLIKVPLQLIGSHMESPAARSGRAWAISQHISRELQKHREGRATSFPLTMQIPKPKPILGLELKSISSRLQNQLSENQIRNFSAEYTGTLSSPRNALISSYKQLFSGTNLKQPEILVLTHERFAKWTSLEEILPSLEKAWGSVASEKFAVRFISVKSDFLKWVPEIVAAKCLIFTEFNPQVIKYLRQIFNVKTPFVIHTHGESIHAVLGYGDTYSLLNEGDTFVCASHAEAKSVRLCLPHAKVRVIPFPLSHSRRHPRLNKKGSNPKFVYVGRVTEQKNLHNLLLAFGLLKKKYPAVRLEIFGAVETCGTPEMNVRFNNYLHFLLKLAKDLKIENEVKWNGFVPREKVEEFYDRNECILVSPSLHGQEDFGIAALNCLLKGGDVVLSAWGGHLDYKKNFPAQVELLKVYSSALGRYISPTELANAMEKQSRRRHQKRTDESLKYRCSYACEQLSKIVEQCHWSNKKLRISKTLTKLSNRVAVYGTHKHVPNFEMPSTNLQPIFTGYDDPLSFPLSKAYGMKQKRSLKTKEHRNLLIVPWVSVEKSGLRVNDPRRGYFEMSFMKRPKGRENLYPVHTLNGDTYKIPLQGIRWLYESGFAFSR